MAELVFIHGVGPPRDPLHELRTWRNALIDAAGIAPAASAAALLSSRTRFVHYADLFGATGAQGGIAGGGRVDRAEAEFVEALTIEMLDNQLELTRSHESHVGLLRVRARLGAHRGSQGAGDIARRTINALTTLVSIPGIRTGAQRITGARLFGDLAQAGRYLGRQERVRTGGRLDAEVRSRLLEVLTGNTVLIAHSLGTIVALEALHEYQGHIPLFVTLGSPLALRTVIHPRLQPQPPSVPDCVDQWLNFWDKDDLFAARPLLEDSFAANSDGICPKSHRVDSDGLWVHSAPTYLSQPSVAWPVLETLRRLN